MVEYSVNDKICKEWVSQYISSHKDTLDYPWLLGDTMPSHDKQRLLLYLVCEHLIYIILLASWYNNRPVNTC